jgi:membrane protease YdiL (CAAX protease family)
MKQEPADKTAIRKVPLVGYGPIAAVITTVVVYFGSQIIAGLVIALLPVFTGWSAVQWRAWLLDTVVGQFATVFFVEALTLFGIWLFLRSRRVKRQAIGLVRPQPYRDIVYAIVGYFVYFALFLIITIAAKRLMPGLDLEQEQQLIFSKSTTGLPLVLVFISLVVLPPVTEEIVVRGFLYTGLRNKLSVRWAMLVTSLLFAAVHLQWGSGAALLWVAAIDTFVLSIILVYLREKSASLWPPILVHIIKNGVAFSLLFVFKVA